MSNPTKITEKMIIDANGKDVVLNGLDFTGNGYLEIKNASSVVVENCRVYKLNCEDTAKNYWMTVVGQTSVQLKVVHSFFGANPGTNGKLYNLFEMDAKLKNKSAFSSNWFDSNCCTHNTINVYGAEENATISMNNNYFEDTYSCPRIGVKGEPVCTIIVQNNEHKVVKTGDQYNQMLLVQPYGAVTKTFGNMKIIAANNKFIGEGAEPYLAYFGGSDTPMGYDSIPAITVDGKDYKMPIEGPSKVIAVVGTTKYETLAAAIEAANGALITLIHSTDEEVDLTGVNLVAGYRGLTVHGVEIEF